MNSLSTAILRKIQKITKVYKAKKMIEKGIPSTN